MIKQLIIGVSLAAVIGVQAETAEEAWSKLVRNKRFLRNSAFKYVKNNPKLPNVFIYGDSISIGYGPDVRKDLTGKANVYRLYRNGSSSNTVIDGFKRQEKVMRDKKLTDPWDFKWDVITVNVGLHDLKYMKGKKLSIKDGKQVNSIEQYKKNLVDVFNFFKKTQPQAKVIFVTTTPVPARSGGRKQGDAAKYNAAAMEVLKKFPSVQICDLYSASLPNQPKWWTKPGNVHYNRTGRKAQGDFVAKAIEQALAKK